jgi:uncharacterized integral membrane protein
MTVVGLIVILFSVSNRRVVTLDLWPLPFLQKSQIFIPILIAAFIGLLFGGVITWLSAGRTRKKARQANRRASSLERDLDILQKKIYALEETTVQKT